MQLDVGSMLGHYQLLSPVGEGGMGVVWKALDLSLGRDVALKFLPEALAGDQERLAMFEREARTLAALNHPNIVTIYSVERHEGRPFLAMEFVDGDPLSALIPDAGLPLERLLELALPLTDAVAAAHQRGVTHRDIKPANVVIGRDGQLKVLDFGVAILAPERESGARPLLHTWGATVQQGAAGTLAYMSPEQVAGEPTDPRSDLFSLGAVLFEMATGRRPFSAAKTPVELIAAIVRDRPESPARWNPALPDPLVRVINACLEKRPEHRPATAGDVRNVLRSLKTDCEACRTLPLRSVAVLPFADLSPERDQAYFCEGLADEITSALSRVRAVRVAPRFSAFRYSLATHEPRVIGEALQVSTLVEGSVRRAGTRLRVTAQLIDAASGFCLWSQRYDRELRDVFEIQDDIAQQVTGALVIALSARERQALRRPTTPALDAYDCYLRGRQLYYRCNRHAAAEARAVFARAVQIDPGFVGAFAGMADCHSFLYIHAGRDARHLEAALEAGRTALRLDPGSAEAHASVATALSLAGERDEAEQHFERAIALNPDLFEAYYFYARNAFASGRPERAVELYEAASRVRPEDYQSPLLVAQIYDDLGRPTDAEASRRLGVAIAEAHLAHSPEDARAWYMGANGLVALGERARGLEWAQRAVSIDPDDGMLLYNIACIYSLAGELDVALDHLDRAYDAGFRVKDWLERDSNLDPLRTTPRFEALLRKL